MSNMQSNPPGDLLRRLLMDHVRKEIRADMQAVANEVIDAAVDRACTSFETHVVQEASHMFQKEYIEYIIKRKNP